MYQKKKDNSILRLAILVLILAIAALAANTNILPSAIHDAISGAFQQLSSSGDFAITLPRLVAAALALATCMLIASAISVVLARLERKNRRMLTISSLVKSLSTWVCAIAAIIWILNIMGIDITAALAGVGIVALVLSFGAQSLVEDVVTGIFIMFEGSFNVGDIIVLDNFRGTVKHIGVRTTVIEDDGMNLKIVNNSDIRNVQNRSSHHSIAVSEIGISYNASIPAAEEAVQNCLKQLWKTRRDILLAPPAYLGVQTLADSAVVLKVKAEVAEENIFAAQRLLNRELKLALDEAGIEIPFPQVVVHQAR